MSTRTFAIHLALVAAAAVAGAGSIQQAQAQALNWEGQTGALVTPFAYTSTSPVGGLGAPAVAFHILNGGEVIGTHFQLSFTIGLLSRMEVGVTRSSVSSVGSEPVASLFDRGFTTVHGKLSLLREGTAGSLRPAVSAGALFRWQKEHIAADIVPSDATRNADLYLVATKTLAVSSRLSVLVSGGVRATKAAFMGIAGNTPSWEARGFASGGVLLSRTLLVGAEFLQQPAHLDGFPEAQIPSTVAYFLRLYPRGSSRFNLDLGLVRAAGSIAPGLDLKAENRLAAGVSLRF